MNPANTENRTAVSLREVTKDTVLKICSLSDQLSEKQKRMVAPNALSIAEAYFTEQAWFRGIYAGEEPVGFVMLHLDKKRGVYYLWRLMIAGPFQRQGFGKAAVNRLIEYVKTMPGATELFVSYVPLDGCPEKFYRDLGFEPTGEIKDGEVVMRYRW
jgi:diamine N-acetyltransferase